MTMISGEHLPIKNIVNCYTNETKSIMAFSIDNKHFGMFYQKFENNNYTVKIEISTEKMFDESYLNEISVQDFNIWMYQTYTGNKVDLTKKRKKNDISPDASMFNKQSFYNSFAFLLNNLELTFNNSEIISNELIENRIFDNE